jgi:large conductance mechanosensitive channel
VVTQSTPGSSWSRQEGAGNAHFGNAVQASEVVGLKFAHQGVSLVKGFRDFISRGNIVELAVAVVIGTAFTAVVTAIVADLITPLIAAIGGTPSFSGLSFEVHHSTFKLGAVLNAIITFLIIAAVVYFLIVAPMAKVTARFTHEVAVTTRDCPECLSSIPIAATRCSYCTVQVPPVAPPPPAAPGGPGGRHR